MCLQVCVCVYVCRCAVCVCDGWCVCVLISYVCPCSHIVARGSMVCAMVNIVCMGANNLCVNGVCVCVLCCLMYTFISRAGVWCLRCMCGCCASAVCACL